MPKRNGVFFWEVFLKTMLLIITLKTSRPIEVFRMPNPLWENSGGTHEPDIFIRYLRIPWMWKLWQIYGSWASSARGGVVGRLCWVCGHVSPGWKINVCYLPKLGHYLSLTHIRAGSNMYFKNATFRKTYKHILLPCFRWVVSPGPQGLHKVTWIVWQIF